MQNFRFWLLACATASMTFIYSNRVVFGFTVICQQEDVDPDYYLLDPLNLAWMFTAMAIGMCVGPLPFYFVNGISTRVMIFLYGLMSALSSLLYPLADGIGFWPALLCRFCAGFAQASQLHFTNDFVLRWTPNSEAGFFFSIMLATSQFAPLITMILGGEMCSSTFFGWQSAYYILGVLTFVSSSLFAYLYSDSVEESPFCEEDEKKHILDGKHDVKQKAPVPYKQLLSDWTIWISLTMFTGYYLAMIVYQSYSPIFIKQVLHFTIRQTGYFSAIPQIIAILIKIGGGKLLDYDFGCSNKTKLTVPLILLEGISAISLFLTGFLDNRVWALSLLMLFASLHFFVPVICSRTIQIRAVQHAHFALNLNMIVAGVTQILVPLGVQAAVPTNTREEWTRVFYFLTAVVVVTTSVFAVMARATAASWTKQESSSQDDVRSVKNV